MRQIVLLSDFGEKSIYTGISKGFINKITGQNNYIELYSNVKSQNIINAAFILSITHHSFANDSIFCCNVDPEIYTDRNMLIVKKIINTLLLLIMVCFQA
jgi:S-adenosylmethionine hydrolase